MITKKTNNKETRKKSKCKLKPNYTKKDFIYSSKWIFIIPFNRRQWISVKLFIKVLLYRFVHYTGWSVYNLSWICSYGAQIFLNVHSRKNEKKIIWTNESFLSGKVIKHNARKFITYLILTICNYKKKKKENAVSEIRNENNESDTWLAKMRKTYNVLKDVIACPYWTGHNFESEAIKFFKTYL